MSDSRSEGAARPAPDVVIAGHVSLEVFPTLYGPVKIEPGRLVAVGPVALSTGSAVANTGVAFHRLGVRSSSCRITDRGRWRSRRPTTRTWWSVCSVARQAPPTTRSSSCKEVRRLGARAALFGHKINASEHQLTFVRYLRLIADGELDPADAVRAHHADLARLRITPRPELPDDLNLTETQHHA